MAEFGLRNSGIDHLYLPISTSMARMAKTPAKLPLPPEPPTDEPPPPEAPTAAEGALAPPYSDCKKPWLFRRAPCMPSSRLFSSSMREWLSLSR